ncbi:hypothetical protein CERSUDRAFT_97719 [Gelatoporia subvermispora B]|uniref:Uncharacterized protein n=1 Tax=Ceriporiopsis subvermispora (strain B) TaxID=914234 RepID=M2R726_CERS8|nr:hypothetical protein CERSUDRAFT_97719 [Gelatoporia subvermispora B]
MLKQLFLILAAAVCIVSANTVIPVTCGSTKYAVAAINRNLAAGSSLLQQGKTVSTGKALFPHKYNRGDGLTLSGCTGQLYEYPLIKGNSAFGAGDKVGPDRVLFDQTGVYCASITHTGAPTTNGFLLCK